MNNIDLINNLKNIDIFKNINNDILTSLLPKLTVISLEPESTLFKQNDPSDALYIVLTGKLIATLTQADGNTTILAEITDDNIVGEINLFAGGKRTANVSAVTDVKLIKLPKTAFDDAVEQYPIILQKMAEVITQRLRHNQLLAILPDYFAETDKNILNEIESKVDWLHLSSGNILFNQGEIGDSLYVLVSGRLKVSVTNPEGEQQTIGEVSQGEVVGEMALFADETRTATVYALRDCDLIKLSVATFEKLAYKYPQLMMAITKLVIKRSRQDIRSVKKPVSNIAIIPLSSKVPNKEFCHRLIQTLSNSGTILYLNSRILDNLMDMPKATQIAENSPHSIRLNAWLDEQETHHKFIIYEADLEATEWSKWCLRRADQILLIADATTSPSVSKLEQELLLDDNKISAANQTLILLHQNGNKLPTGTQHWLSQRQIKDHHHIRLNTENDFKRLARFISRQAVGLVCSGGGARGLAHFGVYLALKEAGIAVDMVGGTSMGAFVGAQCAAEWTLEQMLQINHKGLIESNPFKEFTLPIFSLLGSKKLQANLKTIFGDTQIEDLWLNFFCISSSLSTHEMIVHQTGLLETSLRASAAIPGIAEPVLHNKQLLVDGGLFNNLPGDIMHQFCGKVILSDVSDGSNIILDNHDTMPSSSKVFWSRVLPFKTAIKTPSLAEILINSTMLSSTQKAKQVKSMADLYLCPPVKQFKLLEFTAMKQLVDIGYQHTKQALITGKYDKLKSIC